MNNNHNLSRAPSYAGSNSSSDSSAPGSFHSHDSSALSSIHSHDSSAPSSIHSHFADEEEWSRIQQRSADLVGSLLKEQRESGTMLRAWSVRCSTLEDEVERLARRVMQLEAEAAQRTIKVDVAAPVVALSSPPGLSPKAGSVWRRTTTTIEPPTAPSISTPSAAIPQIDPTKSMSKQDPPPCNSFYLVGGCDVPRCKFSHLYELNESQLEEMRRGAKFHICNAIRNGVECEDPSCCYGHSCPRGSACGRTNCAFNAEQHRSPPLQPAAVLNRVNAAQRRH